MGLTIFFFINMSGEIISRFFVIYLFGTRRTVAIDSSAPAFIISYFLFSIKAAEKILTTCLRCLVIVSLDVLKQSIPGT